MRENYDIRLVQDGQIVEVISISRRHRAMLRSAIGGMGVWEVESLTGEESSPLVAAAFWELTAPFNAAAYCRLGDARSEATHIEVTAFISRLLAACRQHPDAVVRVG